MVLALRPLKRRRKEHIKSVAKRVLDYLRNHLFECWTVSFKAWIGMDIDEPRLEILIHDKLTLNKLEARPSLGCVDQPLACPCKGGDAFLHDGKGGLHKAVLVSIDNIQMALKLPEVYLIARFVFSELIVLNLDALCRKVAELIVKGPNIEGLAGCTDHSFAVQVDMRLLFLDKRRSTRRTMRA